jgi:PAS domain S-box-containing protein
MAEKDSKKDNNYNRPIDLILSKNHETEALIQEQNKRFQVICSSKNDAIITSDETKRILFWNKGAEYIFGYSADEAIGQLLTLIIPHELHQRHDKGMERMNQGKKPRVIGKVLELKAIKKSGEEFPIELTLGSWDNDGKRYYSGIIRDITEKKKAELIILNEKKKSDELLLNILPKQVADELVPAPRHGRQDSQVRVVQGPGSGGVEDLGERLREADVDVLELAAVRTAGPAEPHGVADGVVGLGLAVPGLVFVGDLELDVGR